MTTSMSAAATVAITVTVAIASGPRRVEQREITLPEGATLGDALEACAIDLATRALSAGVWGRVRPPTWRLHDGDRVELCRALEIHPMEARRRRHEHQQAWKAAKALARQAR